MTTRNPSANNRLNTAARQKRGTRVKTLSALPVFSLLKSNIGYLQEIRPDFWLHPKGEGMWLQGSLVDEYIVGKYEKISRGVTACNCSVVMNLYAYFEGCLEAVLLRKIGDPNRHVEPIKTVMSEYRSKIVSCSRFEEFKKYFEQLYGIKLVEVSGLSPDDLEFVERFYVVRHFLAHGSEIPLTIRRHDDGGYDQPSHDNDVYVKLMKILSERYSTDGDFACDIPALMLASKVIDDVCCCVYRLVDTMNTYSNQHGS